MADAKKNRTLLAVLGPLFLGIILAMIFLVNYLTKKTVILTIHNHTGMDIQGSGIRLGSEAKEEEVGPIADKDSTVFQFRNGGSGTYFLAGKLKNGTEFSVSGGQAGKAKSKSVRDGLVLGMQGDTVTGTFTDGAP